MHVKYLAQELAGLGHEVHVLHSLDAYHVKRPRVEKHAEASAVHTHAIKTHLNSSAYWAYAFGGCREILRQLRIVMKDVEPDVVHHHNISLLGYTLFRKCGEYLNLYTAHDYWVFCQRSDLMKFGKAPCSNKNCFSCSLFSKRVPQLWRRTPGYGRAVREIDRLIAPSEFMVRTLRGELPDLHISHIPNFAPHLEPVRTSKEPPYFVYLGVLESHKGLLPLLRRYAKWEPRSCAGLRIIGSGSLQNSLGTFIQSNHMENYVKMMGRASTLVTRQLLSGATALILPSIWPENAPLAALEALSLGTPVVSSNMGGLPEIVEKMDSRLIFSWQDPDGFQQALNFALEHKFDLSVSAKQTYDRFFSPETYLKRYMGLIQTQMDPIPTSAVA